MTTKNSDGVLKYQYFDYLAENKHNSDFVLAAWKQFFRDYPQIKQFKTIFVWSDTALRCKKALYQLSRLYNNYNLKVEFHYYAEYHGHNLSDTHFGHTKQKVRNLLKGKLLQNIEHLRDLISEVKGTHPKILTNIPKIIEVLEGFKTGIRKYHKILFSEDNTFKCFYNSDCKRDYIESLSLKPKRCRGRPKKHK